MAADIVAMAVVLGWTKAVDRGIRERRWKENGKQGHFEPGPAHGRSVTWMTAGLQVKLRELFGSLAIGPWIKIGVGMVGVATSMSWHAIRVEDNGTTAAGAAASPAPRPSRQAPPAEPPADPNARNVTKPPEPPPAARGVSDGPRGLLALRPR